MAIQINETQPNTRAEMMAITLQFCPKNGKTDAYTDGLGEELVANKILAPFQQLVVDDSKSALKKANKKNQDKEKDKMDAKMAAYMNKKASVP